MSGFQRISTKRAALLASTALCVAPYLAVPPAAAQDATWLNAPGSADFNDAANWSPATVPTGTAFFDTSATTSLSIGAATVGGWTFNAGASNYSFTNSGFINFSGAGIAVNGGSATITNNYVLDFRHTSTAGSATITNNLRPEFLATPARPAAPRSRTTLSMGFLRHQQRRQRARSPTSASSLLRHQHGRQRHDHQRQLPVLQRRQHGR